MSTYNIAGFEYLAGVSVKTLRRWDRVGKLKPAASTPGNRRLYNQAQLNRLLHHAPPRKRSVVAYLCVSRQAQKPNLANQKAALEQFCLARGIAVEKWVSEIGGGLNFKRPKFSEIVDWVIRSELTTLVIARQDRLARFGSELLQHLCEPHDCQMVVLTTESHSPEQEMVQDLADTEHPMTIPHCFSSRLFGLRNYRKAIQKAIKDGQSA